MKEDTFHPALEYLNLNLFQGKSVLKKQYFGGNMIGLPWLVHFVPLWKCFRSKYRFSLGILPIMIEDGGQSLHYLDLKVTAPPRFNFFVFFLLLLPIGITAKDQKIYQRYIKIVSSHFVQSVVVALIWGVHIITFDGSTRSAVGKN